MPGNTTVSFQPGVVEFWAHRGRVYTSEKKAKGFRKAFDKRLQSYIDARPENIKYYGHQLNQPIYHVTGLIYEEVA